MDKVDLNDFMIDIFQDFKEIESMLKILKDSVFNDNVESTMIDVGNALEIIIAKMSNTRNSLDKYIDIVFGEQENTEQD
jgi:hypothetical protein